jgi:hypothetical protein
MAKAIRRGTWNIAIITPKASASLAAGEAGALDS